MKVHELIKELHSVDPNLEVIVSIDAEGNGFSSYSDLSIGYVESLWEVGRVEDVIGEDLFEIEPEEYDAKETYKKVVVLWPV